MVSTGAKASVELDDPALLRDHAYVDGEWVGGGTRGTFSVRDPATQGLIAQVLRMGASEVEEAIGAADRAFPHWRGMTAAARGEILGRWAVFVRDHREDLALLASAEQGKPRREARAEIDYATSYLVWSAEEGKRVYGDVIPEDRRDRRIVVLKEPVGVTWCPRRRRRPVRGRTNVRRDRRAADRRRRDLAGGRTAHCGRRA